MWEEILRLAVGNGLWAVLFCVLLIYELRDSRNREKKYQGTINDLCGRLSLLDSVKRDTCLLVTRLGKGREKSDRTHAKDAGAKAGEQLVAAAGGE